MAFDVEYAVRVAEKLRPYRLKWIEECLPPEDFDAYIELQRRLPWQTLTTGEHWYTPMPFQWALKHGVVDILQPDISWCGGLTTCIKIAHAAEAAGKSVMLHGGDIRHLDNTSVMLWPLFPGWSVSWGRPQECHWRRLYIPQVSLYPKMGG